MPHEVSGSETHITVTSRLALRGEHMTEAGEPLTEDEFLVMDLLSRGKMNKQIANFLGWQDTTVSRHLDKARVKLGAETREQAMYLWAKSKPAFQSELEGKLLRRAEGLSEDCE